ITSPTRRSREAARLVLARILSPAAWKSMDSDERNGAATGPVRSRRESARRRWRQYRGLLDALADLDAVAAKAAGSLDPIAAQAEIRRIDAERRALGELRWPLLLGLFQEGYLFFDELR